MQYFAMNMSLVVIVPLLFALFSVTQSAGCNLSPLAVCLLDLFWCPSQVDDRNNDTLNQTLMLGENIAKERVRLASLCSSASCHGAVVPFFFFLFLSLSHSRLMSDLKLLSSLLPSFFGRWEGERVGKVSCCCFGTRLLCDVAGFLKRDERELF